jgi:polyhydroxyalkanoate synthesis regulator phasin
MARRDAESLIAKLRQMSEEGVSSFLNEVMANDNLRRRLGRAGERLLANKGTFDRNVETLLDFVNIPSKRDVRELKARLDHLNGQLVNLSMKIDRMLEQGEHGKTASHPKRSRKSKHPEE